MTVLHSRLVASGSAVHERITRQERAMRLGMAGLLMWAAAGAIWAAEDEAPVARWSFGPEETTPLVVRGAVQRDQVGPRPPEFPDFAETNTAVRLDGRGAHLELDDPGPGSPFDFANGDAITLEAWVFVEGTPGGSPVYIVGKGRSGRPRFARDNQNWALRLVFQQGSCRLGFLFATAPGAGEAHWHRWTSMHGFPPRSGWHHVAVAYRFGEPSSIRGWIDGQATEGTWDMGGATTEPPVVDDDAIFIGSSRGGSASNSFQGRLDDVAVHRALLDDRTLASRFRRIDTGRTSGSQPQSMPSLGSLPPGQVVVTFSEGMPSHGGWLYEDEAWPSETMRWVGDSFLLPRMPLRYDDWGIRSQWQAPVLVRFAADVELPPGETTFLVRARGLSRLWVDGQLVAGTEDNFKSPPDGEEPVTPVPQPPRPGLRARGYRQQEVIRTVSLPTGDQETKGMRRVVWELIVGGPQVRTETGEICVAVQSAGSKSFVVMAPAEQPQLPLTDAVVESELARISATLVEHDDQSRRGAAASQDALWQERHEAARRWARQHPAPQPPGGGHPVDAFLDARIQRAVAASRRDDPQPARRFHDQVLPILREHCFRCHGEKEQGGLKLDSLQAALRGGDSEVPAVVPGRPEESELVARITAHDASLRMPPTDEGLTEQEIDLLTKWVAEGAPWPARPVDAAEVHQPPVVGDAPFLRRIYLDLVGVPPTSDEARAFLDDTRPTKRRDLVEQLLKDPRWADHWISSWLDLLAENPTLINASLNSTGPFRWFIYESLRDAKPLDRMVTELVLMRGSAETGGSAGFAMAGENDAPMAAKAHILASAFLGIELQCARCHDSPYHSTTQRDLFSLAAMLQRKPLTVPATSRVPDAFFAQKQREPLIRVSLNPAEAIAPLWPFGSVTGVEDTPELDELMHDPGNARERLAALLTAPQNTRFAQVMVNRLWRQLMGAGLVEPAHDWEGRTASHPDLLAWLAEQLITHDYDLRHVTRLIVTSEAYQREPIGMNRQASAERRFFAAPDRRRLTAEQIVDSMHAAVGVAMQVEELTFVHCGRRPLGKRQTLGVPRRAWMMASLNNERDRPSLTLPAARAVADVLEAFGWTGSRQRPIHDRTSDPDVLQPAVLANGTLSVTLTRAAAGTPLAELAVHAESPQSLVEELMLRVLSRRPRADELRQLSAVLDEGFEQRLIPAAQVQAPQPPPQLPLVTWFNHLQPEANRIQQERERRVLQGPPADPRLRAAWREAYEDVVWSLLNHREFVWVP